MCPHCGMLRPNYLKRILVWLIIAIAFFAAAYELSHFAIFIGSGGN